MASPPMATPASSLPPPGAAGLAADADPSLAAPDAPGPVRIIDIDPDTKEFRADVAVLSSILKHADVVDLPVAVVSVAGPFRKGKSFLLNFFVRYLSLGDTDADASGLESAADWLGADEAKPLEGFRWRHGSRRETTGLWMWSRPFVRTLPTGAKVAVLLVDTQGTFDNKTTMHENATIFALNSVLSSLQVYNISGLLSEDVLSSMSLFTKLGTWIFDNQCDKQHRVSPFQTLQFLVRDWPYKDEFAYGSEGGSGYLASVMETDNGHKTEELRNVRRDISKCFDRISCFLMPHPGMKVAGSSEFCGRLSDIDPEFCQQLQQFVPQLLAGRNLVPKKFLGQDVTCGTLQDYILALVDVLKGDEVPIIQNGADSFSATQWSTQKELMFKQYRQAMHDVTKAGRPFIELAEFDQIHLKAHQAAIDGYMGANLSFSETHMQHFRDKLEADIAEEFAQAAEDNRSKQLINTLRTPITLGGAAFASHILCTFLGLVGIASWASLLSLVTWVFMGVLFFWAYCQYSGQYSDAAVQIDEICLWLFDTGKHVVVQYYFGGAVADLLTPASGSGSVGSAPKAAAGAAKSTRSRPHAD